MKRIAIITEGQTEYIFAREFILRIIDPSKLSFTCVKLNSYRREYVRSYSCPSPKVHFEIINVQNDERVLNYIKQVERNFIEKGLYDKIIGLRDMYSEEYVKQSPSGINDDVTKREKIKHNSLIQLMTYKDRIKLYYSIMEIEAWFLSMNSIFQKIHSSLSVQYIESQLGYDLSIIDPQTEFFKPSEQIIEIFDLCGWKYDKKLSDSEKITSKMKVTDFDVARENNKCSSFNIFYQDFIKNFNSFILQG